MNTDITAAAVQNTSDQQGADARAQFEAWLASLPPQVIDRDDDQYMVAASPSAWDIWKAALAARQPEGREPVCSRGFVIGNGSGDKYMAWGQIGPEWVAYPSAALWLVRRADAEALAAENEDAWLILPVERCALPPNGWACTLASGHEGPCPTIAAPPAQAVDFGKHKDAARYRWLRDDYDPSVHDDEDGSFLRLSGQALDAAIDDLIDSQAVGNG